MGQCVSGLNLTKNSMTTVSIYLFSLGRCSFSKFGLISKLSQTDYGLLNKIITAI